LDYSSLCFACNMSDVAVFGGENSRYPDKTFLTFISYRWWYEFLLVACRFHAYSQNEFSACFFP
jgi:hypothetical protein